MKVISNVKFSKSPSPKTPRSRLRVNYVALIFTRNVRVKYRSFSTHCSSDITKVRISKRRPNSKGQGHRVTNVETFEKVLTLARKSREISKHSHSLCSKVVSKFKVLKRYAKLQGQSYRVKNSGTHGKVLSQGNTLIKYQISGFHSLKVIARLKLENHRMADRTKQYAFDLWSMKIKKITRKKLTNLHVSGFESRLTADHRT